MLAQLEMYDWRNHAHVLPLFTDELLLARPSILRYLASMDVETLDLGEMGLGDAYAPIISRAICVLYTLTVCAVRPIFILGKV